MREGNKKTSREGYWYGKRAAREGHNKARGWGTLKRTQ